jgi:hypothetical protein
MPPIQESQNSAPAPIPAPVIKPGHSAWFYILMTILSLIGIAIVLFVAAFAYHEVQLNNARQQLQTAEQQIQANEQQVQDILNNPSGAPAPVSNDTQPSPTNSSPPAASTQPQSPVIGGYATIDQSSLTSSSLTPTITGTASGVDGLYFQIYQGVYTGTGPSQTVWGAAGLVPVRNGVWSESVPAGHLSAGTYTVQIQNTNLNVFGTLVINQ